MLTVRSFEPDRDVPAVLAVDRSLVCDGVLDVEMTEHRIELTPRRHEPVRRDLFPLTASELTDHDASTAWVAELDGGVAGFLAVSHEGWARRTAIYHMYVSAGHRRLGVGRALLAHADDVARREGSRSLWLETSNLNLPGVRAYQALGFRICGLDSSLYDPRSGNGGQVALFMSRDLP